MNIYLIRHGNTIDTEQNILSGQRNIELSETGIIQVKELALTLKKIKFDLLISSDLKRTIQTSKLILKYHQGTPLLCSSQFRERYFGFLEGKPLNHTINKSTPIKLQPESKTCFISRVSSLIREIILLPYQSNVAIIAHGGTNRIIKAFLNKENLHDYSKYEHMKTADYEVFCIKNN